MYYTCPSLLFKQVIRIYVYIVYQIYDKSTLPLAVCLRGRNPGQRMCYLMYLMRNRSVRSTVASAKLIKTIPDIVKHGLELATPFEC